MKKIFPNKLKKGDKIKIIAPSRSLTILSEETKKIANKRFEEMGLHLVFGKHIEEMDDFASTTIESRIEDLHDAFSDNSIKGIITVIGGFNSNQLLNYIDWDIIKNNPKVFCGYSDITVLNNSIYAKTGLVTYSGPHYSTFGQKLYFNYTLDYFQKCLMSEPPFEIQPSKKWSDDPWFKNQDDRHLIINDCYLVINEGVAEGTIIGANLNTFNLLQGTQYIPSLDNSVLFIEDDEMTNAVTFDRDLQSVIHQPGFSGVKGIAIGRFQKVSKITNKLLVQIIKSKKELESMPVIANVDFGHTDPKITIPIGGTARMSVKFGSVKVDIQGH